MQIWLKRAYEEPGERDGTRILVDGIWPRGGSKEDLKIDLWLKEIAPSKDLRKWFGHDPARWDGFRSRYLAELASTPEAVERCLTWCRAGSVILLFAAKDCDHNQAVVLRDHLREKLTREDAT